MTTRGLDRQWQLNGGNGDLPGQQGQMMTTMTSCAADRPRQWQRRQRQPPWAASAAAGTDDGNDLDDVGGLHGHMDNDKDND